MISSLAQAQEEIAYFQDFTVEDGLSSTGAIVFFQDSRGIVWIGTSYGLNSYDGTTIKSYLKEDIGICHNYIRAISEDGKGNLWILAGDYGRQAFCYSILDPIANKAYSIEEYTGEPCPFNSHHTWLYPNHKGTFIIKEIQENNQIQFHEVREDKIEKGFDFIYKDPLSINEHENKYPDNVYKLNKDTYTFHAPKENHEDGFPHDVFLLKSSGKTLRYRPDAKAVENVVDVWTEGQHFYSSYLEYVKNPKQPTSVSIYKNGQFLAKTNYIFNVETSPLIINGNLYKFHPNYVEKYLITKDSLVYHQKITFKEECIIPNLKFVDRGGNVWFFGLNKIIKLSLRPKNFKLSLKKKIQVLLNRSIRGITSSNDGTIYAGELCCLNIRNANDTKFNIIQNKYYGGHLGLLLDGDKLWLGKEQFGLGVLDTVTKERIFYGSGLVWQPYKSPDGTIWAGGGSGLSKLDTLKKDLVPFSDYGTYDELKNSSVYHFHLNEKGTWLSTSSGLYLVDLAKEKILAHYSDAQNSEFYIPANHIAHIHEDKEGIFWLASKGQGLVRWNPATGESEQLTKKNTGLSHNVIYAVYEDDFGNLWLPSDYGLNCLNKTSRQVSLYLKDDGLPNNEFNTISHHQDKEGKLYFGTVDGMIEFHPKDFNHQAEDVPFIITAAHRIDQRTDTIINQTQSVIDYHSLTIRPNDKAADFKFALLDYKKTDGNQYSYKIEGYKEDWIYQKEGDLRISGLPYGNYQLLLRGKASGSNTWINYAHPITIHVAKPFYLQWWFILSALAAMTGLVYYIIKRNTKKLLERQQELETIVEERTEEIRLQAEELKQLDKVKSNFFANISHELRTPLTLILGPLSYLLDHPDEWNNEHIQKQLIVMQRNGKSLMQLIEEILDLSKLEANKLELEEEGTPISQFFEHLFFVFEPQFQSQELDYELILNVKDNLNVLLDRKKMEKVFNNFLSNAIKFTPKQGKVTLQVSETDTNLLITVSDTGKGIHPRDLPHIFERFYQSKQADQKLYGGTGIGLALVNEFAQLMGGKASVESILGTGSKFFFEIPKKEVSTERVFQMISDETEEQKAIDSIGTDFTILVVEDNEDMRNFISQLLQKKYKKVLLADNGAEGLKALETHGTEIDLIVSDVMMPHVDGLTMLKEIKNHPKWHRIPVVMLTALAAERDKLNALTIGVDDYLTKPFSVPELLIRIQNLLYNFHQRKEWQEQEQKISDEPNQHKTDKKTIDNATPQNLVSQDDKIWIDKLKIFIEESLGNTALDAKSLAASVFLSPRQLNRKLKSITGLSPAKFIKEVQLQTARKTLENGAFISISEVAQNHGFEYQGTFSTLFKQRFGKSPREYLK